MRTYPGFFSSRLLDTLHKQYSNCNIYKYNVCSKRYVSTGKTIDKLQQMLKNLLNACTFFTVFL